MNHEDCAQKVHKKHKTGYFIVQIIMYLITQFFVSFIWYLIITEIQRFPSLSLKTFLKFFMFLFYKLKVQHESAPYLLCSNMLHFYVALFWKVVVTNTVLVFVLVLIQNIHNISLKTYFLISQPSQTDQKM